MPQLVSHLLSSLEYAFAIITLLGGVIAVHEFGHFFFAKLFGIRVDTFSLGFGPKLFSKKIGETEYCLSLVPLGGFVKIYGQDPEELELDPTPQPLRAFSKKSLGQKVSVLVGGPLFNYFLAIFIFTFLAIIGIQRLPALATRVVYGTPAFQAGLRSGDEISNIDGKDMHNFDDVEQAIAANGLKTLDFRLSREGKILQVPVYIAKENAVTAYGENSQAGVLDGLEPFGREAVFAVSGKHPWGIESGDKLLRFNSAPISSWEDLESLLETGMNSLPMQIPIVVSRAGRELNLLSPNLSAQKKPGAPNVERFLEENQLFPPELFVEEVMKGSPAEKAGLKKTDHILAVNGQAVYSFDHLRNTIQASGEAIAQDHKNLDKEAVRLTVNRGGKTFEIPVGVSATKNKNPLGETIISYTVGIVSAGKAQLPKHMLLDRTFNPFVAVYRGAKETMRHTIVTVVGIKKLITGEASLKSVGGPIMIGKLAGETLSSRGWRDFLQIMAVISISLGVFNLLPVPILDGGYIVIAVVESLRGKPMSQQVTQVFLKVGLSLILILMVFAFYNDISRVLF